MYTSEEISNLHPFGVIYGLYNIKTNKWYIGQTTQNIDKYIAECYKNGKGGNRTKIAQAIKKYGWESFRSINLDIAITIEELNKKEIEYMVKYDSIKNGYNLREGGSGRIVSPESIKRMSDSKKGKKMSQESIIKRIETLKRNWELLSEEEKEIKIKERKERVTGKNNPMFGNKHGEKFYEKRKIHRMPPSKYKGIKKSPLSVETKKKISEKLKNRIFTDDHLNKLKIARKLAGDTHRNRSPEEKKLSRLKAKATERENMLKDKITIISFIISYLFVLTF